MSADDDHEYGFCAGDLDDEGGVGAFVGPPSPFYAAEAVPVAMEAALIGIKAFEEFDKAFEEFEPAQPRIGPLR